MIKTGKFGRFVACNRYPECKATFTLPKGTKILTTQNVCKECGYPMIQVIRAGTRPQEVCINPDCPSKKNDVITSKEGEVKTCPKCGAPLVLRKSFYGQFYGCSKYPDCKYIENIGGNNNNNNDNHNKNNNDNSGMSEDNNNNNDNHNKNNNENNGMSEDSNSNNDTESKNNIEKDYSDNSYKGMGGKKPSRLKTPATLKTKTKKTSAKKPSSKKGYGKKFR